LGDSYDLMVIGTGTAATTVARKARAAGRSVAVTDFRPYGGTCALRGCDPKQMLIGGASAVDHATRMRGKGVAGDVAIDWTDLMAFKRGFTDPVPEKKESGFAEAGIDGYHGHARFAGRNGRRRQRRSHACYDDRPGRTRHRPSRSSRNFRSESSS